MLVLFLLTLALPMESWSLDNGLALTPPMGFLSWQKYRCSVNCEKDPDGCISENLFIRIADLLVSEGYKDIGYEYVIIDDCWLASSRDKQGRLQPNPERFPSGLKALGDYIHGLGLKFGIYEDIGTKTCAGYPGLDGNFDLDAQTFADWGVDYVKVDGCYFNVPDMPSAYIEFGKSLNKTGRPIVYSCSWPAYEEPAGIKSNYSLISEHCNLWRNWGDIDDNWGTLKNIISFYGDNGQRFAPFAGPGRWNDPDMLLVGENGISYGESRIQMALWATMASPLLMSTDLKTIHPDLKAILQNKDIIAINQDPLGYQGERVVTELHQLDYWVKKLTEIDGIDSYAIAAVNYDFEQIDINMPLVNLGLPSGEYQVWDLFDGNSTHNNFTTLMRSLDVEISGRNVVFVKATLVNED